MISEIDAKRTADELVRARLHRSLPICAIRFDEDPWAAVRRQGLLAENATDLYSPCWSITFETVLEDGEVMDGGTIVIVDAESGKAQFFEEAWAEMRRQATPGR